MMRHVLLWLSLLPAAFAPAQQPDAGSIDQASAAESDETGIPSNQQRVDRAFFEKHIRPVLATHCYECHAEDADDVGAELLVDSKEGLLAGGQSGPAVVPGNVDDSLLISALEYHDFEMPPEGQLPVEVIRNFRQWVKRGALDPRDGKDPAAPATAQSPPGDGSQHWAFQPIVEPALPAVTDVPNRGS